MFTVTPCYCLLLLSYQNCLSQMRGGREFQTTIDSSEEDDEGEESESLHNGERQQASNTAANDGKTEKFTSSCLRPAKHCIE